MKKRFLTILFTAGVLTAQASTFEAKDNYSIDLPDTWVEIPEGLLIDYSAQLLKKSKDGTAPTYNYGYQLENPNGYWLTHPYILVELLPQGRMPSAALQEKEGDGVTYDKDQRILWATLSDKSMAGEPVKARVALIQTEVGLIRLTGCATEASYEEMLPFFEKAFSELKVDKSIQFQPRFLEDLPPVGGMNTGQIILWVLQSAVIGLALWAIYILIKRSLASKKTTVEVAE